MGMLNAILYGSTTMGDFTGYDPNEWIDDDSEYWTDNDVDADEYVDWTNEDDGFLNIADDNVSMLFVEEPVGMLE